MSNTLRGRIVSPEAIYGKSAYELAILHGFEGTEEEWVTLTMAEATRAEDAADRAEAAVEQAAQIAAAELASIIERHTYDGSDYYTSEGPNLFNINDPLNSINFWDLDESGNVILTEEDIYNHSHPIKVYSGKRYKYYLTYGIGTKMRVVKVDGKGNSLGEVVSETKGEDGTSSFIATFTGYVSFNYTNRRLENLMFCEEDRYPAEYTPFSRTLRDTKLESFNEQFDERFGEKIQEVEHTITPEDTTFVKRVQSENLLDLNGEFLDNCYMSNQTPEGEIIAHSQFKSYYVPLRGSGVYSIPVSTGMYGQGIVSKIPVYDKNKNSRGLLTSGVRGSSGELLTDSITHAVFTVTEEDIQSGVAYIGFTMLKSLNIDTPLMIVKGEEYPSEYIPFVDELEIEGLKVEPTNPLNGKILSVNGDSICAGTGYSGGYGKIIAENNHMVFENVGAGGGTITAEQYYEAGTARHWICRTIANMNENADYAIVEGGVNDSSLLVPIGAITEGFDATLDDTTFCGAFESILKQLTIRFAGKKIGYIAVHKMSNKFRADNADDGTSYYWAAKKCCAKWGVPFLDLNTSVPPFGFFRGTNNSDLESMVETYTYNSDGWHPNEECYKKYYVPKIEAWLKTL